MLIIYSISWREGKLTRIWAQVVAMWGGSTRIQASLTEVVLTHILLRLSEHACVYRMQPKLNKSVCFFICFSIFAPFLRKHNFKIMQLQVMTFREHFNIIYKYYIYISILRWQVLIMRLLSSFFVFLFIASIKLNSYLISINIQ